MPSVSLNENSVSAPPESQQQAQPGVPHSYPPPPPHQQIPPPPPTGHHQYPGGGGGYPYPGRGGYEHGPHQHHVNNSDPMAVSQQHPYQQQPYPPHQQPQMRFPGKPLPGGPPTSQQQQQPPPGSGQYPPQQMRSGGYPPTGPAGMTGQSISQPTGPTPTLNQLLQPSGGGGGGPGGSNAGATGTPPGAGGAHPNMPGHGGNPPHRYPPPPSGYDQHNSYNMPPHSKSDYNAGPQGWPPPGPNQRPPLNSYGHPPPPQFQQQAMYRQNASPVPGGRSSGGPPGPPQHPGQYYQPPGMHHPQGFPPPPPQSPHYPPPHAAQRYPGPGSVMRPGENQPPSHYPPGPGVPPESSGLGPSGPPSSSDGSHAPKSTPPPPQSPSLAQQQINHAQTNPPSPQQSPRSTPVQSQPHLPAPSSSGGIPPASSPSHRPQGSSPSSNSYPPPSDADCNSNDSGPGANVRPSPSPTGSASSRSMSPAVGSQNIPVPPPRPSSSQSDGSGPQRMSQSPMSGSYQSMAPPPHHGYPPGGKMSHQGMIPPGHPPPPNPQHYPQQNQQHWQHPPGQQGYGARPPHHGGMMSPYPPPPSQQPMPPNNYPPQRHPVPNHVGGPPPPQNQYSPYPPPQYGGPQPPSQQTPQPWASPNAAGPGGTPPNPNSRSHPPYLKQHLQQKMGFSPPPHGQQGYGGHMGPPQSSNMSTSPSQTPPPGSHSSHGPSPHHGPPSGGPPDSDNAGGNPPNIVSVGPDGTSVDDVSQQSTLSNTSGASGGDDGPAMPKLRKEGSVGHQNYTSHPTTPTGNAVPSPGAVSMSPAHEEYGEMNSPGWPRTPASPGLNSHPQPPSEQFKPKAKVKKKPDSLQKMYDMDDNPDRRGFLDKLMQYMDELSTPITACPTISKNPLDLFKLYFLVKERGGFVEVTKNKTWKDIAGSLGIGASSSAAYTLRKHYTKHLLPFECKYDRGGIDPQPLINQVETTSKKKGAKVAPVPSPGSSNSQDSFQGANNNSTSSMDGFNNVQPSSGGSGGPPTPYGSHPPPPPPSEYNQQSNSSSSGVNSGSNSTPPLRPPTQSPGGPSAQSVPPSSQLPPHPHPGEKTQLSASNPFDDLQHQQHHPFSFAGPSSGQQQYNHLPPNHFHHQQQHRPSSSYAYHAQSCSTSAVSPGYQGPPGSYQPYSSPGGEQYPGRQPHDAYNQQAYGGAGYPQPGPGGRPMYPQYPETSTASSSPPTGPQQPGYPPQGSASHQSQAGSQPTSTVDSSSQDRYSMGPPPSQSGPGAPGNYPGGPPHQRPMPGYPPTSSASGHPPPNGYPNQDYYHSQPPPNEQGYPMSGQSGPQLPGGKHGPPHGGQRRVEFPPGKDPNAPPGSSPPSQGYPGYPPQGQQRMPYDGQGAKGGFGMYGHSSSSSSGGGVLSGGRDHGSGIPGRSNLSPSASPAPPHNQSTLHHHATPSSSAASPSSAPSSQHQSQQNSSSASSSSSTLPPTPAPPIPNNINKPPWITPEGWPGSANQYPSGPHQRPYPGGPPNAGSPGIPPPSQSASPGQPPSTAAPTQPGTPPAWATAGANSRSPGGPPQTPSAPAGQWPHSHPGPPDHSTSRYGAPPSQPGQQPSTPNTIGSSQPPTPWTPPNQQGRSPQMRPPFPVPGKGDMYKGYGPAGPGAPPSPSVPSGPPQIPVPGTKGAAGMPPPSPVIPGAPPGATPGLLPGAPVPFTPPPTGGPVPPGMVMQPHIPQPIAKKEIVFPPDSVEAVNPVLRKRKKLHKTEVAPVDAWRIMMCLKSGLLAETTWALDVLNILLYDDHSVTYFSLTYLPGLLNILLEHLRRALILIFGTSIGIEMEGEDIGPVEVKRGKWFEINTKEDEEEPDIGTPRTKFPRDAHRTVVLQGSTNYTMMSRIGKKTVGIVSRDDEPFVIPGPRDWDSEEKMRQEVESDLAGGSQPNLNGGQGLMELTRHVVTSFTADLNIVPVVRQLKPTETVLSDSRSRFSRKRRRSSNAAGCSKTQQQETVEIKREPQDCDEGVAGGENDGSVVDSELNLDIYRCETKLPNLVSVSNSSNSSSSSSSNNSSISIKKEGEQSKINNNSTSANHSSKTELSAEHNSNSSNSSSFSNGGDRDSNGKEKSEKETKNNCQLSLAQQNNRKLKRLDEFIGRIKQEVGASDDNENAMDHCDMTTVTKPVNGLPEIDDNSSMMMDTNDVTQEENNESSRNSVVNGGVGGGDGDNSASSNASNVIVEGVDENDACDESNDEVSLKDCVKVGSILVRDHGSTLKRRKLEDYEDECYARDEASLYQVTETQDALARRCLSIFNILRNLTFVPGNDIEFGKNIPFLSLLGKLLLIHHEHPLKGKPASKKLKLEDEEEAPVEEKDEEEKDKDDNKEEEKEKKVEIEEEKGEKVEEGTNPADDNTATSAAGAASSVDIDADSCTSLNSEGEWWWEYVHHLREHVLVMIANISGQMDLSQFSEEISRPILDGLLHWAVCPAAYGQDPFPTLGQSSVLSPQRLAIEALCKLSVTQGNMDLLLATPPFSRIERLCQLLCRSLYPTEDQVMREFAINLLSYLSAADSGVARTIALQNPCISLLISFIEQAEANANNISMNHGFQVLRENPDAMGTSLDMLRRAATTLFNLARHPDNRGLFVQHEPRLLSLVMSHILEQKVAATVAQVLYQCSAPESSSSKYMYHSGSSYDTFYSIARSRSIRNKH